MTIHFNTVTPAYYTYECLIKCYKEELKEYNIPKIRRGQISQKAFNGIQQIEETKNKTINSIIAIIHFQFEYLVDQKKSDPTVVHFFQENLKKLKEKNTNERFQEVYSSLHQMVEKYLLNPELKKTP